MFKHTRNFISFVFVLLSFSFSLEAVMYIGNVVDFKQPDGSTVKVRLYGNDYYITGESLDGYTVIRDDKTGWFSYAAPNADGSELLSTGVHYTDATATPQTLQNLPAGLKKNLHISKDSQKKKVDVNRTRLGPTTRTSAGSKTSRLSPMSPLAPSSPYYEERTGNYEGFLICIDFPDEPATISTGEIDNYANQIGYSNFGNNGSVRDFYKDVSHNKLNYTNLVVPVYFRASQPRAYYEDTSISYPQRAQDLITEALTYLNNSGYDFTSVSRDTSGYAYALNIMYAGGSSPTWMAGLWPHSSWLEINTAAFTTHDGVTFDHYMITNIGSAPKIGTFCHENGHMLMNWEDCYDYYYGQNYHYYDSLGDHCLMGAGNYCGPNHDQSNPVPPNAYFRYVSGWEDVTEINSASCGTFSSASGNNTCYIYRNPLRSNDELFIVENRQQNGRDTWLPSAGLAIWHIDQSGYHDYYWMDPVYHYQVSLEQADSYYHLENYNNYGDDKDFFKSGVPGCLNSFNASTNPNSNWWLPSASGLNITNISVLSNSMTFNLPACLLTSTSTPTFTASGTFTKTPTVTATPSRTPSFTATRTGTLTFTPTRTGTITFTGTRTRTATVSPTRTRTNTITQTATRTRTASPTYSRTRTSTPSPTGTRTRMATITPTWSRSSTASATGTRTRTTTITPTWSRSSTASATGTRTRTATPTSTGTITQTVTLTSTLTNTPSACITVNSGFGGGFVTDDPGPGANDGGYAITTGPDNKVYVAGYSGPKSVLWRYNSNGSLDTTFGSNGRIIMFVGSPVSSTRWTVRVDSQGKILVAGAFDYTPTGTAGFLNRYNNDGSPDNSFMGILGWAGQFLMYGMRGIYGMTLDSANRIVLAGRVNDTTLRIIRLNVNGSLDGTLGGGAGYVDFAGGSTDYSKMGIVVDANGMIYITDTKDGHLACWRFWPDGTEDGAFTKSDILTPGSTDKGNAILFGPTGGMFVVGTSKYNGDSTMFLAKITLIYGGFLLDGSFGSGGVLKFNSTGAYSTGNDLKVDTTGKLVITGSIRQGATIDTAVWRYNPDGTPDNAFSPSGYVLGGHANFGTNEGFGCTITQGGLLVTGNYYNGTDTDMAMWGFTDNCLVPTPTATFTPTICIVADSGFAGGFVTDGGSGFESGYAVAYDSSSNIFVAGNSNKPTIWKYTSSGALDGSFGSGGKVIMFPSSPVSGNWGAIRIDSLGRVLAAGQLTSPGGTATFMMRYLSDGSVDNSFMGIGGWPGEFLWYNGALPGANLLIDFNNKIVIASRLSATTIRLIRLNDDGSFDTTFGAGSGYVDFAAGSSGDLSRMGLAVSPYDGRIIVADSLNDNLAVWSFNTDGTPNTGFGAGGLSTVADIIGAGAMDKGNSVAVDGSGMIYVTGSSSLSGSETMFLARFDWNGVVGCCFGTESLHANGIVSFNGAGNVSAGNNVLVDGSDNIVVTGVIQAGVNSDMAVWRYNNGGKLDTSFNTTGLLFGNRLTGTLAEGYGATITASGKLVVTGLSVDATGNTDMALWSYVNTCGGGFLNSKPSLGTLAVSKTTPTPVDNFVTLDKKETYMYPNPAADSMTIRFPLSASVEVNVSIYDINGKPVWHGTLGAGSARKGINTMTWNAVNDGGAKVSNGVYIVTISAGGKSVTKKAAIVK